MALLLKNLLFTVLVPGTVAGYVPFLMTGGRAPASAWHAALALPVFLVGAAVFGWCVWDFATFGRGTPAPIDAPRRLVVRGLYRYTRNPMYVGVLTVIAGWALLFSSPTVLAYGVVVGAVFHLFAILYEEPHLQRVFGAEYDAYRARVGRWLPGMRDSGGR